VLVTSQCIEIPQLPDRNHADKIFLMPGQSKLIGLFGASMKKICARAAMGY
jgi:hypothetical protein